MNPLRLLAQFDVLMMLIANSITFAIFTAVQATTSLIFQKQYTYLTETLIGVCFIPTGLGAVLGSVTIGKMLDRWYKKDRKAWVDAKIHEQERNEDRKRDQPADEKEWLQKMNETERADMELTFPAEKARLKAAGILTVLVGLLCIGFGWAVDKKVSLALPLIFQFGGEALL